MDQTFKSQGEGYTFSKWIRGSIQQEILQVLNRTGRPMSAREILEEMNLDYSKLYVIRPRLTELWRMGKIEPAEERIKDKITGFMQTTWHIGNGRQDNFRLRNQLQRNLAHVAFSLIRRLVEYGYSSQISTEAEALINKVGA